MCLCVETSDGSATHENFDPRIMNRQQTQAILTQFNEQIIQDDSDLCRRLSMMEQMPDAENRN